METTTTDVIVIGAGAVGENVVDRVIAGGLEAIVVEHELVGGECSYWACEPSKTLLRSGAALRAAQRVPGAAEAVTGPLDAEAVLARRNARVGDWDDSGQVRWLEGVGATLVRGHARLDGERRVRVTGTDGEERLLDARHAVVVATGSAPKLPDIDGLALARPWTSREATSAQQVPGRLAIIGGGVVGCEMATAWASLGSEVTLLSRSGLLSKFEPFASEAVAAGIRSLGVDVRTDCTPIAVHRDADDRVVLALPGGEELVADEVLVATGRRARVEDVGLETVGLDTEGWIDVDDTLRVRADGLDWLYAAGDVTGRALLTHQGKYQARAAGDAIAARAAGAEVDDAAWGAHVATADDAAVPQVAFTEPEAATVGLTAADAEQRGIRTRVVEYDLGWVAGATDRADGYEGRANLVVDEDRRVVVGATFVGQDVAELLHAATIAVVGEVPIDRLWHAVPSFPTLSEVWLRLLEAYGRPGHEGAA
ncbi:dihydrolipoyl dehydrogenase family protein [Agromyces mangrovi Wang et al. 2018]|uniref:dihydrolipoyl dehydrogenase family protein n=1 Tax=Agromyces mangrovi TaxID=1858653 RepID=UPI0025737913|nr:NAD(P)/FAD-dependent oxidoreductase [Agromyces mangrovi]BDZ65873.1 oxidoreductase [Agromyces mangrovi]